LDLFRTAYLPGAVDPDVLQDNHRDVRQQVASLRLTSPEGEPTVAGVLSLARDVRQWLPGAYIQFVRYAGEQLTDPILDQKEIDGPLADVLRAADETINIHITTPG
jgi:ATP-dependent DNA helicase RecG